MRTPVDPLRSQPRIVIVTGKLDRGGAEQHIARIAPALKSAGIDIEVFLLERGGTLEAGLIEQGVAIHGLLRSTGQAIHFFRAAYALFRYLRAKHPDAVHFFLPQSYLIGTVAAIVAGCRVRIMSRRSLNHYQLRHPLSARLERLMHRSTAALLGNSKAVVEQLICESSDRDKIGLIYNGIGLPDMPGADERRAVRSDLALGDEAFVIVVVANLIPYKGHRDLIDALAPIVKSLPNPWKLIAVGRDEGDGEELRRHAVLSGLADYVVWLGERRDVQRILSCADLFVLPSHQEGFSNALIEAMSNGLPIIATAVGGNIDAIVDDETGRLVDVQSPKQLRSAILQLALDPGRRKAYGAAARRRVEQFFSLDACVAKYRNLYRGLKRLGRDPIQSIIDGSSGRPV